MRQLLMLGFYCEVYRREPLCRVYANDFLLDEFNIPHTPRIDEWTNEMTLDPKYVGYTGFISKSNPSFYKLIGFDYFDSKSLDIRVEIKNDDNNYANGFMTQHTRIMLCQCWLAPVKIWQGFDKIKKYWKFSQHNWHGITRPVIQYYSKWRSCIFNNLAAQADMHFPDITQQPRPKEQLKLAHSNYQDLPRVWQTNPTTHWIGSSGYFHMTLMKKLGFWRHSTDRRRGWCRLSQNGDNHILSDKYLQYENTRDTDQ